MSPRDPAQLDLPLGHEIDIFDMIAIPVPEAVPEVFVPDDDDLAWLDGVAGERGAA